MIIALSKDHLPIIWPQIEGMIEKALEYGNHAHFSEDIYEGLNSLQYLALLDVEDIKVNAVAILEIFEYPRKKVLNIFLCAGKNFDEWAEESITIVNQLAVEQGLDSISIQGRQGWERKLNPFGFEKIGIILERAVQ